MRQAYSPTGDIAVLPPADVNTEWGYRYDAPFFTGCNPHCAREKPLGYGATWLTLLSSLRDATGL
jgi:hypothetical protein